MLYGKYDLAEKLLASEKTHSQLSVKHWLNYELYTWQWWAKFIYLTVPIIIFYKFLDRKRSFEIVAYGLLIALISTIIDVVCVNFALYTYPIRLVPIGFFSVHDLIVIPIVSMLVYQYNTNWKRFIIANLILGALGAYIKEPLYTWINIYKPINWSHTYSFLLFFIMAVFCKYIVDIIIKSDQHSLVRE